MSNIYLEILKNTRQKALDLETEMTPVLKKMYRQSELMMIHVFNNLNEQASNPYRAEVEFLLNTHHGCLTPYLSSILPQIFENEQYKDIFFKETVVGVRIDRKTFRKIFCTDEEEYYIAYDLSSNSKDLTNEDNKCIVFVYLDSLVAIAKKEGINIDTSNGIKFSVTLPTINQNAKLSLTLD